MATKYRRRLWARAVKDWWFFVYQKGLDVGLPSSVVGLLIAACADRRMNHELTNATIIAGLIGATGGPLVVGLISLLYFRLRAPRRLDEDRAAEIESLRQELAELRARDAERQVIKIGSSRSEAFLRARLNFPDGPKTDVFFFSVEIELVNEAEQPRPVFLPTLELLRKDEGGFWQPFQFKRISSYPPEGFRWPKGFRNTRTLWLPDNRYELPAGDATVIDFHVMLQSAEGRGAFLGHDFQLRVTVRFIGLPNETIDIALPKTTEAT